MTPSLIKVALSAKDVLPAKDQIELDSMIKLLDGWQGQMDGESVQATVYAYTTYYVTKSLFLMTRLDPAERLRMTEKASKYHFEEALIRIIDQVASGSTRFNPICQDPDM